MFREWKERGPFVSTLQRMCDQARTVRKWFIDIELEGIVRTMNREEMGEEITDESG